jgi:hypothetical protein
MPLTDEQKAALKVLADVDTDELTTAIHQEMPEVHTAIFNQGHQKATKEKGKDVRAVEKKLEEAQAELTKRDERIQAMEATAPDATKIRDQYQGQLREAEAKHKAALDALNQEADQIALKGAKAVLRARFAKSLLPDAVDAMMAKLEAEGRVRVGEGRTIEVLQTGKDIPIMAPEGKDPLDILAEERIAAAPALWRQGGTEAGGGQQGGGAGATGYDPVADGKARAAAQKAAAGATNLALT